MDKAQGGRRDPVDADLERLLAQEALREDDARYSTLADMIPQYVWTTDPDGYHDYFSRRWYEYTGATPEDGRGEGWLHLLHPDDRERTLACWNRSLRSGEPYATEFRVRNAAGSYHWFLGQARPRRDDDGRIIQWFGTLTDIDDRKRLEQEREQLLAREREAREQVTTILESITDAFFALDREWRFTYLNHQTEPLFQRSRAELLGRVMWDEFPEARGSVFERGYRQAAEERRTVKIEEYYPPLDIWVDVRAYPSDDGLSVFIRDITPRKRAEDKLRESERNFRALANTIPQLAWMADSSGWIFWYNDRWHDYTGTSLEEMEGWGWRKVHHPDHVDRVVERIKRAFESGEPWEDTFPLRSRTGEYRWFLSRALPIKDASGNVLRWFGTNTDITEAERRREEIERVTESRERLMRGFSHDVRNPLGVADAQAWLLEDGRLLGPLSGKQRECVARIRRSIRGSLRLIEDLLEVTRAEAGQLDVQRATTDVVALAREAAEDFRAPAMAAGISLEVRAPEGLVTETDGARVSQILANLLSNAVKYAAKGPVSVDAKLLRSGGPRPGSWIALSVSDTGPGIPQGKRESIFEEFTRLDPSAQPGAGIGLAISRRIARLIGGDLTVSSETGSGSTFTLWLPAES